VDPCRPRCTPAKPLKRRTHLPRRVDQTLSSPGRLGHVGLPLSACTHADDWS
jgi:hypothetical protein